MEQAKRISRTYVLRPQIADDCRTLADILNTNVSDVVEKLLKQALEEVESGRWAVDAVPTRYEMRLINGPKIDRR